MFRRRFIQSMTWAGLAGSATARTVQVAEHQTVTYRIEGFTCVACAVGLETMLRQQKGIVRAAANYTKANVQIEFNPAEIGDESIKGYISEMGFRVARENGS